MKVRILSGNQAGAVVDMPQIEAENAIATGYAKLFDEKDQVELDKKKAGAASVEKPAKQSKTEEPEKGAPKATPKKGRRKK